MNLKLKQTAIACALALGSSGAFALGAFDTPDIKLTGKQSVFLSGASAPQNFLGILASGGAAGIFQGVQGTDFFVYYDNGTTGTKGASYRAYFGRLKTTAQDPNMPASIANKTVLLVDRAKGGSVWGVNPVARAQAIAYMAVTSGNCVTTTGAANYICGETGNDVVADGNEVVPDFGVSDVEPKMFKEPRNTEWDPAASAPFAQLSAAELTNITNKGVSALMFGQAVTLNTGLTDIPAPIFGGMLSGSIKTWAKVNGSAGDVMVCRRWPGSGTQASYNNYYNNFPCAGNSTGGNGTTATATIGDIPFTQFTAGLGAGDGSSKANAIGIDASSQYIVIQNSASGDVRTCLQGAQLGNDFYAQDYDGTWYVVQFGGAGVNPNDSNLKTGGTTRKAIGTLSLDSKGNTGYGSEWTFANLSGVTPTQDKMVDLSYDFSYELSMQYRTGSLDPLPAGDVKTFVDYFIKKAGDPAVLSLISNANVKDSVAAVPILYAYAGPAGKVMKGTRFGNSCQAILPQ